MVNWPLIAAIVIPNAGCWIGTAAVWKHIDWYNSNLVKKVWFNPPNWALSILWTGLYSCMGYASYLVYRDLGGFTEQAALPLSLYGVKLLVNWLWVPLFMILKNMGLSFIHMLVLDALVIATTVSFSLVSEMAAYFMIPYAAWLICDTTISYFFWKLNKDNDKNF